MKYVLREYDRAWMTGARGEKPVLCPIVWVNAVGENTRSHTLRSWANRNRLFILDYTDGQSVPTMRNVQYRPGEGFFIENFVGYFHSGRGARRRQVSITEIMRRGYLFTNGIY